MKIESLASQPDRAGRYLLRFEDGTNLRLYRQTIEDFRLFPGQELSPEELSELHKAAGLMSAKMRAVRIVAASSISRQNLQQRLVYKGENPDDARQAVEWMTQLDLLNDQDTASQIVSQCVRKGYGLSRAKQALYEKRIPKELWQEALEDYPDQSSYIMEFLDARLQENRDVKHVRRAVDALLRRGHSYSQIRRALDQLAFEDVISEE